jgi:hypothetical protein
MAVVAGTPEERAAGPLPETATDATAEESL